MTSERSERKEFNERHMREHSPSLTCTFYKFLIKGMTLILLRRVPSFLYLISRVNEYDNINI